MKINLYPEMNAKIVGILRVSDEPSSLYAAERIEQLEMALEFYEERDNYIPTIENVATATLFSKVEKDCGKTARQALGKE